ncbi:MAG: N-acetyl-gamma-glutamyl-phosphate reductase [Oscillospiraceae bacterium]|nr:N-acetyl-gamma-glutamyl-phosphate reductase [Oscillospiraceae bacterium]
MLNLFIDGREGTTGLQIEDRLRRLRGVRLLDIAPDRRKDPAERRRLLREADAVFLCLPDAAAREAAALAGDADTVIFDASTAHRTAPGWAYGFPELSPGHREAVRTANRIAVPGCHATGFCALVYPLVSAGLVSADTPLSCFSLTGYSGGGKAMIGEYEGPDAPRDARMYALGLTHKHLPEMTAVCRLSAAPVFLPVLIPVSRGMLVSVPLSAPAEPIYRHLAGWYDGAENVRVMPFGQAPDGGRLAMEGCNGSDALELFVYGHDTQTLLTARLDNLGKGASGAAVQCLKLRFPQVVG